MKLNKNSRLKRNEAKLLKFPGGEIIRKGLNDIRHHRYKSIEALAVFIASPRLNEMGFRVSENFFAEPHLLLYDRLTILDSGNAFSRYKSVMARVAKFCNHYSYSPARKG